MKTRKIFPMILTFLFQLFPVFLFSQNFDLDWDRNLNFKRVKENEINSPVPVFSFLLNGEKKYSNDFLPNEKSWNLDGRVSLSIDSIKKGQDNWTAVFTFSNISKDTLKVENFIPFGGLEDQVYITGKGDHRLSRSHLFRPGYDPVNVILPDNAWELGYSSFEVGNQGFAGLMRRKYWDGAQRRRFETILPPNSNVSYRMYVDSFTGDWQEGLKLVFQKRFLYDLDDFDYSMYQREDLKWIRKSYAMHLMMAWDADFYDREGERFTIFDFQQRNKEWFGGDDVIGIWPTWPTLGLDQRNQWDLFRDLPGGLDQLASISDSLNRLGTKFFISYNPWDESTRLEGHLEGMTALIKATKADGVVLDTKGSSSLEIQQAADLAKPGVVMYSEGMAVPKDMPGIVSGRVHNALYYPPLLNLNKLIKPDFAIFRVAELAYDRIRREYATSFFNGYGTELNIFRPGRPEWMKEDYRYFGKTLRILRENHSNFISFGFTPLIPTLSDGVFVNKWPLENKTIYTILSLKPEGFFGNLFEVEKPRSDWHYVDLWNHEEMLVQESEDKHLIPVDLEAFHQKWLGTNNEGAVGSIAYFPKLLEVGLEQNKLSIKASKGNEIRVWAGVPEYGNSYLSLNSGLNTVDIRDNFGRYEGKIVVQLFESEELMDEQVIEMEYGIPRLISSPEKTPRSDKAPKGMVKIPSGSFEMKVSQGDQFIPYPTAGYPRTISMDGFYMDRYPITNQEFKEFLKATGYQPLDKSRFLAHWVNGQIPEGMEQHPVVNISLEDAQAYAKWAGKRLPTEAEWQYAASSGDGRDWPWDQNLKVKKRFEYVTNTLTVEHLDGLGEEFCNIGNGIPEAVGSHPKGKNPWGLEDLVGSVWQMTSDIYDNGTNQMMILKGGSYFKPSSSWWYVQGGPRETHYRQMLLRVSPGFERNETVGFRCVADY
ncbi:formylglycine-generating enzyme family protein [Aquiflexum gelatinilyticum]|uniref:formylglycine-generating enzyme family protein n=1 Tax=Aquiflexum gelatinilyticum TaxID=2961943 RepID=UPI0021692F0D|nr:formylglycine-generating enzyme family protein [Aquiflexum gelatinilyticum]MCS4432971.1 formylglycine-generating enzyme family protein [Aquiflexum gelatinilyticum]